MSGISVNGLVEGEECGRIVERLVQSRPSFGVFSREASDKFLEVCLALSGSDRGARAIVVVERLQMIC